MDRKKPREHRPCRRVAQKRSWLASLLNSNLLKLGAGVSVSVASCGFAIADDTPGVRLPQQVTRSTVRINPFVTPTAGPQNLFSTVSGASNQVMQTSDLQFSELRLKSIGTAVGLVPIGQPRSVDPVIEISQPQTSTIRVNPMAGGASDLLDQPVINLEEVDTETTAPRSGNNLPRILSLHRTEGHPSGESVETMPSSRGITHNATENLASEVMPSIESQPPQQLAVAEQSELASDEVESISESELASETADDTEYGVSFSFSDHSDDIDEVIEDSPVEAWVIPPPPMDAPSTEMAPVPVSSVANETVDESVELKIEPLPLLPIPHRQWVAQQSSEVVAEKYPQRHRQHVEIAAPPMIAAARAARPGAVSSTPILRAKLAGFLEPKSPESTESAALDPIAELTKEIHDNHSTARVSLTEENTRLVVRGVCRSREQATDVIRLIRSRFLIPVDDQLVVR